MKKSKGNILITRTISDESPLWQLSNDGYHLIAQSFLEIVPLTISEIPSADVYFYYSKNAAKYFFQASKKLLVDVKKSKHAAMGKGTANVLSQLGVNVDFVGQGSPTEISNELINQYSESSICFVRAKESTQSIQKNWPKSFMEIITYHTKPSPVKVEEEIDVIIATSPKNFKSAMHNCRIDSLKKIICIGPTTYDAVQKYSDVACIMATESNEDALLNAFYEGYV